MPGSIITLYSRTFIYLKEPENKMTTNLPFITQTERGTCSRCDTFLDIYVRRKEFVMECQQCVKICIECKMFPRASFSEFCQTCLGKRSAQCFCKLCGKYTSVKPVCKRCTTCVECNSVATCGVKNGKAERCYQHRVEHDIRFKQKECRGCSKKFQPLFHKDTYCVNC